MSLLLAKAKPVDFERCFTLRLEAEEPLIVGKTSFSSRGIVRLTSGRLRGSNVEADQLSCSLDEVTFSSDGFVKQAAIMVLRTQDGAILLLRLEGQKPQSAAARSCEHYKHWVPFQRY